MLDFVELKGKIQQELKQHWRGQKVGKAQPHTYAHFSFHLPLEGNPFPDLIEQLLYIYGGVSPLCYWRDKQGEIEVLGLGATQTFHNLEFYQWLDSYWEHDPKLIFLGGQRFFPEVEPETEWERFGQLYYILPKVAFLRHGDSYELRFFFKQSLAGSKFEQRNYLSQIDDLLTPKQADERWQKVFLDGQIPAETEWEQMIDQVHEQMDQTELQKVVLARKWCWKAAEYIAPLLIFKKSYEDRQMQAQAFGGKYNSYCFYLQVDPHHAFMSFSPETLFSLKQNTLEVEVVAGTRPYGDNPVENEVWKQELLSSDKDQREHNLVDSDLRDKLAQVGTDIKMVTQASDRILLAGKVQHLYGRYQAQVAPAGQNLAELLALFHPTPAVGGTPWDQAKNLILNLENFDRGFYAAPMGYLSYQHKQFMVGIRSALVCEYEWHTFGGAGIVADSTAESEWLETERKMISFKETFQRMNQQISESGDDYGPQ